MRVLILLASVFTLWSCQPTERDNSNTQIVCTTGMIADMARNLVQGIDSVEVKALMDPGTDPHLYKASQSDVFALSRAELIIYNGLHLEGKMTEVFAKMPDSRVYAVASVLKDAQLINASDYAAAHDPHIWFDLALWSQACEGLAQRLIELFPQSRQTILGNKKKYRSELALLDQWAKKTLSEIPDSQRVLVTAHDAFKYFGAAYQVEVRGLQGISTTAEYGIGDISALSEFLYQRKIKAVFIENSVDPRAIEAVIEAVDSRGGSLTIGGELYSDAMGAAEGPAGSFFGMFEENVRTIHEALK